MGIIATVVMAGGGYLYLRWRENVMRKQGEVYTEPEEKVEFNNFDTPNFILSLLPLLTVLFTLNLLKWDIIVALLSGIVLIMLLNIHRYKLFIDAVNKGALGSVTAIINTSAAVGFGLVVSGCTRL